VDHPQTTFRLGQDKQVIVYFEWKGPAGPHHLKGTWLDPTGKVNSVGTFDYVAPGPEFSGYWVLTLSPGMQQGMWALQAQIDGKPAGVQTFRITGAPPPPPAPTASQVYQQAMASTVFVVALDEHGDPIRQGSGFFIGKGEVATTFSAIDGASQIEIDLPDGSHMTTQDVLGWDRKENWALLEVQGAKIPPLKPAPANGWVVGGSCYVLSSPGPGARTIERVAITGTLPGKVKRFSV
jgi:S1-C subfamily serine protease